MTPFMWLEPQEPSTRAIDDLARLAEICRKRSSGSMSMVHSVLWAFCTDLARGCYIRADSVTFDFHKWGQAPYDAGFLLVRRRSSPFDVRIASSARRERGPAGLPWPCDFGPDLSRGFRALKVWFMLKTYGSD